MKVSKRTIVYKVNVWKYKVQKYSLQIPHKFLRRRYGEHTMWSSHFPRHFPSHVCPGLLQPPPPNLQSYTTPSQDEELGAEGSHWKETAEKESGFLTLFIYSVYIRGHFKCNINIINCVETVRTIDFCLMITIYLCCYLRKSLLPIFTKYHSELRLLKDATGLYIYI